jgi:methylmalonyl-CoA/ethylmalonyl-CoA epimerase
VFTAIDHTGIAVSDIAQASAFYRNVLGLSPVHRETLSQQGVEAVLFDIGESHVELIAPLGVDGAIARFLEQRGPGLHHVAYRVDDIDTALASLSAAGVRLIDERPRAGIRNSRVAFLHPAATGGVLTEIVEPAHHQSSSEEPRYEQ